jgi:hypothetical protein
VESFKATAYGKEYFFIPDDKGLLTRIKIIAQALRPEMFYMTITPREDEPEGKDLNFSADMDQVHEILSADFQYFEGVLALQKAISKIDWQAATFEYLPETAEERKRIAIPWYKIERAVKNVPLQLEMNDFGQIILRRNFHGRLLNQFLAFYREGQNDWNEGRFIKAFLNFYFVLEGAFSEKDRWRNFETREDFLSSIPFLKFVGEIIADEFKAGSRLRWYLDRMLANLTDNKGRPIPKAFDAEGIAWLLVATRGGLLHFKVDESNPDGLLRFDDDYEAISTLGQRLAQKTMFHFYYDVIEKEFAKIMDQRKDTVDCFFTLIQAPTSEDGTSQMEYRRPKIYFIQFLLIPVRIIIAVPLIIGFLLVLNALKALIALSGFIVFYGLIWLLDRFVWPGVLNIPEWLFTILVILTYVLLFYGAHRLSSATPIKTKPTPSKKGAYEAFFEFIFEAKYIEPAIEIYGPSFPKPTFEDFDLEAEEYYAYNRRFTVRELEFVISVGGAFVAGFIASYYTEHIYAVGIIAFFIVLPSVIICDQLYSRTYPQYPKVRDYNRAKKIYDSIQTDIRTARIKEEIDKKYSK